jgi:hypothetical protein
LFENLAIQLQYHVFDIAMKFKIINFFNKMEHTTNNSPLRQKLEQHDLGYRQGAWENFEVLMNANPIAPPKKTFWNLKKWFGVGAAAILLGSIFFFSQKSRDDNANTPISVPMDKNIETSNFSNNTEQKTISMPNTDKKGKINVQTESKLMQSAAPQIEANHFSQQDDNSLPQEDELKIRPQQQYQRTSKSGSDDSGVLPVSTHKTSHESMVKNGAEASHNKVPDVHDLQDNIKKTKQNFEH